MNHILVIVALALMSLISVSVVSDVSAADSTADITVSTNDDLMGTVTGSGIYGIGSTQIITATANAGYSFKQWNDGDIQAIRTITVSESTAYVAQFIANQYQVVLDNQSPTASGDTSITVTFAQALPTVTVPSKTDYLFYGYYTEINGAGEKYINSDGTSAIEFNLTCDTTLYAYWYQNTHMVTLHNVGADDAGTISVLAAVGVTFPDITVPSRADYVFAGYYTGINGSGIQYVDSNGEGSRIFDIDHNTILYAYWISINGIMVIDFGTDLEGNLVWIIDSTNCLLVSGSCKIPDYSIDTAPWVDYRGSITSITFGSGIYSIGEYAFYGCMSLSSLTIPDTVTSAGTLCFGKCSNLVSLTVPISLELAFTNESYFTFAAFSYCYKITELHLTVGSGKVVSYNSAESEKLPWCISKDILSTVVIDDGIKFIPEYMFYDCYALNDFKISKDLTTIGEYAFYNCSSLKTFVIPNSVTSLGYKSFNKCSGLESLTIPISIDAHNVFSETENISDIHLTVGSGCSIDYASTITTYRPYSSLPWYLSRDKLTSVDIDDGVLSLGSDIFNSCAAISKINIPFSLKEIASSAFDSITFCDELGNVISDYSKLYGYTYEGTSGKLNRVPNTNFFAVNFDSAGGTLIPSQETYCGYSFEAPPDPTWLGHTFNGWYLSDNLYDFSTPVSGTITLTAHWILNKYTVSFDSKGGSPVESQYIDFQTCALKPTDPEYLPYTFRYWTFNGSEYNFSTPITADITLIAIWKYDTFNVIFNTDGGSNVDSQTIGSYMTVAKPSNPTKTGYSFVKWTLNGVAYDFSSKVTSDLQLTAEWTKQILTVTFDSNGGSLTDSQTIEYGSYISRPNAPTLKGYIFKDWLYDGSAYDFSKPVTQSLTLVASWSARSHYTVNFDSSGGSNVPQQSVVGGECASPPDTPSREGYNFQYWAHNGLQFNFESEILSDITLTATWNRISFKISFDSNGGSGLSSQTVYYGDTISQPGEPSRTGYYFVNWMLDNEVYDFHSPVYADLVLKANWGRYCYTVSFETGEGSNVSSQLIEAGSFAQKPADPVREGYTFSDWLMNGNSYDFSDEVVADITITAYWVANKYTISFDSNGGSEVPSQNLTYGSLVTKPADPTRPGYNFSEWKVNGQSYFFNTGITDSITLIAYWTDTDKITITFNTDGGSAVSTQIIPIGDTVVLPENPVKPGYVFSGWMINGQPFDSSQSITCNCMLSASWVSETELSASENTDIAPIALIALLAVIIAAVAGFFVLRSSTDVLKQIDKLQIKPPKGDY